VGRKRSTERGTVTALEALPKTSQNWREVMDNVKEAGPRPTREELEAALTNQRDWYKSTLAELDDAQDQIHKLLTDAAQLRAQLDTAY